MIVTQTHPDLLQQAEAATEQAAYEMAEIERHHRAILRRYRTMAGHTAQAAALLREHISSTSLPNHDRKPTTPPQLH